MQKLRAFINSPACFRAVLILLIIQAAWIACTARYPMAFDEDFHLGIIRIYAHHLNPFLSSQPAGADAYGAVARDPSYMYHYLMSFPYRLISLFTGNQTVQVMLLRAINIGLFAWGLTLFRRLLRLTRVSDGVINLTLLFYVLIPIVPMLAGQINYDNLFIPLTAMALLTTAELQIKLRAGKVDVGALGRLLVVCMLASLVKYAFLPVFAAIVLTIGWTLYRTRRNRAKLWRSALASWRALSRFAKIGLLAAVVVTAGLFVQRDGINVVTYHDIVPDCQQVLSVQHCSSYGPWIRDYNFHIANVSGPRSPLTFTKDWFNGMWLRLFFAVDGPASGFETRGPLFMPSIGSVVFGVIGLALVATNFGRIRRRTEFHVLGMLLFTGLLYTMVLWLDEYKAFVSTGQPVAINGRYLLPILPPFILLLGLGYQSLVRRYTWLATSLLALLCLCFLLGGGVLTFIIRSNDGWYWPSPAVHSANHAVQRVLTPIVPGANKPTAFLR